MINSKKVVSISFFTALFLSNIMANVNQMDEQTVDIGEVVVSANGFEQDADKNLRNVIVIDGSLLEKKGFNSIEQALEKVSEINFVDFGLGRNIDMRGQGNKSNMAVKVMVDGRAINVLDNSHGVTPLNSININNVSRIEIIPGGGSIIYGNGTRGGVVNIITKKSKEDSFSINTKSQSYKNVIDGANFGFDINKLINDNVVLTLNAQGFDKNGFQRGYQERGHYINTGVFADINENSNLSLSYNHFKSTDESSGYLTKTQIQKNPKQKGSGENITKTDRSELILDYRYFINDAWELNLSTFWQDQKILYAKDVISMSMKGMTAKAYQDGSGFNDSILGFNFKAKYNYSDDSYIVAGYDFLNHDAKRTSLLKYSVPPIILYHNMETIMDMNKQSHSWFILNSHQFNDFFVLSGGTRYEWNRYSTNRSYKNQMQMNMNPPGTTINTLTFFDTKKYNDNIAFEITPTFIYSNTGSMYLKYERGFISPSPAQFVSKDNKGKYYSSRLDPEVFHTFEIGINDILWDFHAFKFSIFYTQSKDEISYLGNPHSASGSWWKYYNIDQTKRFGTEVNLKQKFFNDALVFKEGMTYIDASISKGVNDGLRIPYVSKINLYAGVDYYWNSNLNSFIDLNYHSRAKDGGKVDDNTGKITQNNWIKDYMLIDLGSSYVYKNLQISAGIRNLFDKKYYTYQDSVNDQYLPGIGRNYYTEFKYVF
ncbi:TonB-dependent receptor [Campylobacter insulaenigrae]|uniref:TonB-dependent receptor n=1 Tax=Campylobacter insulaenigrae TaxID=260714 RepID=UPI002152470E|nr:TonB-dependent receptor [Campylobacter insulaenigrae]MCR6576298.1 TonB-dependent receptor [Campylobacter insulaenigrae]